MYCVFSGSGSGIIHDCGVTGRRAFYELVTTFEPPHDKTNKMTCAPSEDSDRPGHPPSLIRVFAVRSLGS